MATSADQLGALAEGVYVVGTGNTGAAAALATMGAAYCAVMTASAGQSHIRTSRPFFSKMACKQHLDLRCVLISDPSTLGCWGQNTSPHAQGCGLSWTVSHIINHDRSQPWAYGIMKFQNKEVYATLCLQAFAIRRPAVGFDPATGNASGDPVVDAGAGTANHQQQQQQQQQGVNPLIVPQFNVTVDEAFKTPQFWLLMTYLTCTATGGMAMFSVASQTHCINHNDATSGLKMCLVQQQRCCWGQITMTQHLD